MKTEYTVMKQVGEAAPDSLYGGYFDTFDKANSAMLDYEHNLDGGYEGYLVRDLADAKTAVARFEEAAKTRVWVAKRQVTEWEEANNWDND
jgi:hypothetical protein